jgi:2-amino-4-hydroxy-6-hydroxymethyldihydropteridine diphosphokinase
MTQVYIGLGSNLDKPNQQLDLALQCLAKLPDTELVARSSLYLSRPMGPQDQPNYVNAVALLHSQLTAEQLLCHTQEIEHQQGRVRKDNRWGPRTLDLDILLYGQDVIQTESLIIPHYGMKTREFVLYPLYEIAKNLILPSGEKIIDLIQNCPLNGLEKLKA